MAVQEHPVLSTEVIERALEPFCASEVTAAAWAVVRALAEKDLHIVKSRGLTIPSDRKPVEWSDMLPETGWPFEDERKDNA